MPHSPTDRESQAEGPQFPGGDTGGGVGGFLKDYTKVIGKNAGDAAIVTALATIPVVGPFIAAAYVGIKSLARFLGRSKDKITEQATALQQAIEISVSQIMDQVRAGTLDVDSALAGLQQLDHFTSTLGSGSSAIVDKDGRPVFAAAGQMANLSIARAVADLKSQRNREIATPFQNPTGGAVGQDTSASKGVFGSPNFQRDRLRTGLTDFFTGGLNKDIGDRRADSIGDSLRSAGGSQSEDASFPEIALRFNDPLRKVDEFTSIAQKFRPTTSPFQEESDELGSFIRSKFSNRRA